MRGFLIVAASCVLTMTSGCVRSRYAIDGDEVRRLAAQPAEARGQRVRVIQETEFASPPVTREEAEPVVLTSLPTISNSDDDGEDEASASDAAVAAAIVFTVVGGVFTVAAVTEGVRFDGWANVPSDTPLYLDGRWMNLRDLTKEQAEAAHGATLLETSPDFERLERADLNRVGGTYGTWGQTALVRSTTDGPNQLYGGMLTAGYYMTHTLGIELDARFRYGSNESSSLFDLGAAVGPTWFPLSLGIVHLGGYGKLGYGGVTFTQNGDSSSGGGVFASAGGALEVELSTRLTLQPRVGYGWFPGTDEHFRAVEAQLGLVAY
jgi:hypothetical protein